MEKSETTVDAFPSLKKLNLKKGKTSKDSEAKIQDSVPHPSVGDAANLVAKPTSALFAIDGEFPVYKMDRKERGIALIINNETFCKSTRLPSRKGTDADASNLDDMFKKLGFETKVFKDVSVKKTYSIFKSAAKMDHKDKDAFAAVFLSHGDEGVIWGTDGSFKLKMISDLFRGHECPSLAGKPKLFIMQACRGSQHEEPVVPTSDSDVTDGDVESSRSGVTIPAGSDYLFCYSATEGFYSHRDTWLGSWYIQVLTEIMKTHIFENKRTDIDFLDILTLVNYKVALKKVERAQPSYIGKKQMPCFLSLLTKKLYLLPKEDNK